MMEMCCGIGEEDRSCSLGLVLGEDDDDNGEGLTPCL